MPRHLHIDAFAGIAGDMFLAACIDLGAPLEAIDRALRPLPIALPWQITIAQTFRHAIRGLDLKVHVEQRSGFTIPSAGEMDLHHHHSHDSAHPHHHSHDSHAIPPLLRPPTPNSQPLTPSPSHTTYRDILGMIEALDAPPRARQRARDIAAQIATAEAHVHGIPVDAVHFHEVGAVDSIIDMLGSAVALELLDVETVSAAPLPIGRGFVKCAHGNMPLPAPATAEILRNVPHYGVDWIGETVTPTGAAIVAALAPGVGPMPAMRVDAIGYGAGDRDPAEVPNLLRLFLGTKIDATK